MARVLIIDDNAETRGFISLCLRRAGFEVLEAASGAEGIALYHETPADALVIDVLMPEKGGLETMMELRGEFPRLKVIAISGGFRKSTDADLSLARTLEVDRTLAKPFAPEDLIARIKEVLAV
ncbi:MAG: response regulator [Verrucomicrobia bacterium]|nr:response regulator [Verrucomicrobiota bacterium]